MSGRTRLAAAVLMAGLLSGSAGSAAAESGAIHSEARMQGFEKTSVAAFDPIFKMNEKPRFENLCSVYQKNVQAGKKLNSENGACSYSRLEYAVHCSIPNLPRGKMRSSLEKVI